ncbi:MAG TPA: hypothetical protein VK871_14540, partial [Candidatus Limnocylindrales bacterium]|nr:hypothetical protein [Candidatus Limnocylindrales bacterium]
AGGSGGAGALPSPSPGGIAFAGPGERRTGGTTGRATPPPANVPAGAPFGIRLDWTAAFPIVAWFATSALGVVLFALFLRRPVRDEEAGLSAAAAIAAGSQTGTGSRAPVAIAEWPAPSRGGVADGDVTAVVPDAEASLPRWLRPSLRAERRAGMGSSVPATHEPARFDAPPKPGAERRTIAYRVVRVSDQPDEIRSREVGRVDRGDEVEIIGEAEGFLRIVTPWGLEGWVPRVVIVG